MTYYSTHLHGIGSLQVYVVSACECLYIGSTLLPDPPHLYTVSSVRQTSDKMHARVQTFGSALLDLF